MQAQPSYGAPDAPNSGCSLEKKLRIAIEITVDIYNFQLSPWLVALVQWLEAGLLVLYQTSTATVEACSPGAHLASSQIHSRLGCGPWAATKFHRGAPHRPGYP